MTRTPGDWKVGMNPRLIVAGDTVGSIVQTYGPDAEANAVFIVQAVNHFDAMLDALRAAAEVAVCFYDQRAGCADTACRVCARNTEQYQRLDAARAIFAELDGTP